MEHNDRGARPRQGSGSLRGPSRPRPQQGDRARVPASGPYHGPRGTRQRPSAPRRSGGPGYPLRARSINFQSGRARRLANNRRILLLGALAVILVALVVVAFSSCVRGCSSEPQEPQNPVDERVAVNVPEELSGEFKTQLDRGEKLAQIAANADAYENQALLQLALDQPAAIDFVAAYPEAEKVAHPYGESVEQGTAPQLWCWDERWGNVDYAGGPLALTGSGPTALSMAYMGLTGANDRSPADIAALVEEAELASGDSLMSGTFLTDHLEGLGLSCSTYSSNEDNLVQILDTGTYLLVEVGAGTLTDEAHWVLVVTENADGSLVVYDPTSPDVSAHPWDPATIAGPGETLYALSVSESGTSE